MENGKEKKKWRTRFKTCLNARESVYSPCEPQKQFIARSEFLHARSLTWGLGSYRDPSYFTLYTQKCQILMHSQIQNPLVCTTASCFYDLYQLKSFPVMMTEAHISLYLCWLFEMAQMPVDTLLLCRNIKMGMPYEG